jgi:hypothetical protein
VAKLGAGIGRCGALSNGAGTAGQVLGLGVGGACLVGAFVAAVALALAVKGALVAAQLQGDLCQAHARLHAPGDVGTFCSAEVVVDTHFVLLAVVGKFGSMGLPSISPPTRYTSRTSQLNLPTRRFHEHFQAKMAEEPHGYCVVSSLILTKCGDKTHMHVPCGLPTLRISGV